MQEQHRQGLQQAVEWLSSVAKPVGIIASGGIARGNPGPSSDLYLVILHDRHWVRRVQRCFNRTPIKLFFNTETWLRHFIHSEASEGRPVMAHMLATGALLLDVDGRLEALKRHSQDLLQRGPDLSPAALLRDRYAAADQVGDALDFGDENTPDATQAQVLAVHALVRHAYLKNNQFLPRPRDRLRMLAQTDPALAELLAAALGQSLTEAKVSLSKAAKQILGDVGFFEWGSGRDISLPPTGI